jgi:hypothetical protein
MRSSSTRIVIRAMTTPSSASRRLTREAPRVGEFRRGARLRTTSAGTWFPAVGPDDEPAGLLLVHPGVDPRVLVPTIGQLAELNLPGVLTPRPALIEQAGRSWLVAGAPPVPTLADVLDGGPHRAPANAAALLSDVAATLLTTHRAGLAHGALDARSVLVGQDGAALLTDWGTNTAASAAADVTAWTRLAELLAEHWCADDVVSAAALARAANAAAGPTGLAGGFDQLRALAHTAERATLARTAKDELDAVGRGEIRPPRRPQSRRATRPPDPASDEPPAAAAAPVEPVAAAGVAVEPPEPRTAEPGAPAEPAAPATPPPSSPSPPPSAAPSGPPPAASARFDESAFPEPPDEEWLTGRQSITTPDRRPSPGHGPHLDRTGPDQAERRAKRTGKRGEVPRWQLVLLATLVVVTLVAAAADLVLVVTRNAEASALKIQSVVLWAQRNGAGCTLLGVITTNGEAGTVTYGWTGDTASGPAISQQVPSGHTQVEITRQWTAETARTLDPLVTLQVLQPSLRQASVQPDLDCAD